MFRLNRSGVVTDGSSEPVLRQGVGPTAPRGRNYPFATGTAMYDMAEPRFTRTSVFFMPADLA
jgi:hypothetical protein